jgi:hypothetical protein
MDLSGTVEIDARENPPLASVTGTLALEGTPRPAGKIFVILANRLTSETSAAEVTPKGTFDFSEMEVRPGRYDVVLNIAEGFQIANIAARGARVTGKTLEISGGSVQLALTATRVLARVNSSHAIRSPTSLCSAATRATATERSRCVTCSPARTP